jgi:hypothetical protein
LRRDEFEQLAQTQRGPPVADLGGGADRHVEHEVRRAGGHFLRQDRGDHLLGRVDG